MLRLETDHQTTLKEQEEASSVGKSEFSHISLLGGASCGPQSLERNRLQMEEEAQQKLLVVQYLPCLWHLNVCLFRFDFLNFLEKIAPLFSQLRE